MTVSKRLMLFTLLCLLLSSPLAIGQGTSGTISGTVIDPQGAVVPGATVTIKNLDTGLQRQVASNADGYYRAVGLPPGPYEVRAERQGFSPEVRSGLTLTVAEEAVVNLNLRVSGTKEEVIVTGEAAGVETANSTVSGLVDEKKIRDLPLNGRDMAQLILLQPGVVNSRASVQSANTGRGTRFSVAGARPSQNLFQLDGTTINDALNNTPGSAQGLLVGVETVKEFRVLTSTYSAEYGRATGGVFLAVTKSGTNEVHGSAFEFLRNDVLDARNFFDRCPNTDPNCQGGGKPPFRRNQFGGTVGGPIIRNRTFFFGSYEGLRERKGITTISLVPDDNARLGRLPGQAAITVDTRSQPIIDLYPKANGRNLGDGTAEFIGTTNRVSKDDFFTVKVDHKLSDSDSMFVRYLYDDSDQVLPRNFPEFPNQAVNRKQVVTIEERKIISARMVNELRLGFNRSTPAEIVPPTSRSLKLIAGRDLGEVNVTGLTDIGTDRTNPKLFFQSNLQVTDHLSLTAGRHNLKLGFSFDRFQVNGNSESRSRGQLRFRSLADLLRFRVRDLQGASADSDFVRGYRQSLFGFYVQDDFKVSSRLTLNLGVRYDLVTTPTEVNGKVSNLRSISDPQVTVGDPYFNPSRRTWAPRFGFAYDVTGSGKTALRGGFGIFNELPLFSIYRNPVFRSLPFVNRGTITTVTALPVDPSVFKGVDQVTETFQFDLRPTYVFQYNLNLQREVSPNTIVSLAYVGSRGVNLFGMGDVNTAIPQILADGRAFFPAGSTRRNPKFAQVRQIYQGFSSNYNSLNFGLVRRFSHGLQLQTSYTFGRAMDDRSGTSGRQEYSNGQARNFDPYNRRLDHARADFDVRHNFVANATYELPFGKGLTGWAGQLVGGWQLNTIITLSSGVPFTPLVDGDPDRDATDDNAARPNLIPGVSLTPPSGRRTPDLWFNPAAFAPPEVGFRGTAGRNIITGPNFRSVDFSIVKTFRLGEKRSLQFRAEAFDLLNRANFDLPSNSQDGEQVFSYTPASGNTPAKFAPTASLGQIFSTVGDAREIQFALKFIF